MITLLFFLIFIFFANAYFECDDTTKQCNCTSGVCNKVCTDYNKCQNYQFYCSNQSNSCSVACLHSNSCQNAKFYLQSTSSSVRCLGPASCSNSFFECGSRNTCVLESDPYSFIQSQFVCNGHINHINECRFQVLNDTTYGLLSCAINAAQSVTCEINAVGLLSCPQSSSTCSTTHNCSGPLCGDTHSTPMIPDNYDIIIINITDDIHINVDKCGGFVAFFDSNTNIWIITIVFMTGLLSSCILYYCCLSLFSVGDKRDTYNNNIVVDGDKSCDKSSDDTEGKVDKIERRCSEINHFESSFWFTLLSTLFNDEDQTDGIDCGLILIPAHIAIYEILNSIFSGCIQCKVPVTQQFLRHYGKTSRKANSYIVIQSGYIYAHEIYKKSKTICELANNYIVIDSQKKHTQKHNNIYYRIFVNNVRVKSAGEFCNVLQQQHGITVNLSKGKESTTTWTKRESLELSLDFFESKAAGMEATTLANALHYLQERRRDRTESGEMLGATIVVIPYDKTLQDYKLYLRQYLNVSILVSDSSLLCIFTHTSVLHDGAIFVRGNRIIAVKAFFRITGQYKKKACIGHGTRHASAQEFTKHARSHNPVAFVLSEEDGLIRSCIAGQLKKIDYKFIPRSVMEHHHHSHKFHEEKTSKTLKTRVRNLNLLSMGHVDEDENDLKQEQKQQDHEEEQTEGTEGTEGNNIQLTSINYTNSATRPHANGTVDDDDGYDDI